MTRLDAHRLGEERSLAMHRVIAERLASEPELLERARRRVERWFAEGGANPVYAAEWRRILSRPIREIAGVLVERSEAARTLRSVSPFAGALDPRERWRIHRQVREALARDQR